MSVDAQEAFVRILGEDNIDFTESSRISAAQATYEGHQTIAGLLFPQNLAEIQDCLKIAREEQLALYPISKGKNWGYGSKRPARENSYILSLEHMNQILDYSETLAYVTVEPGVTFAQLNNFLIEQKSSLMLTSPGSTPEASIIGNALQRGIHQGMEEDFHGQTCTYEVILADGSVHQLGQASGNSPLIHKSPLGPDFQGSFQQANLGIVTKMTILLSPFPEYFQGITLTIDQSKDFENSINQVQKLKMKGVLNSTCQWMNSARLKAAGLKESFWRFESAIHACTLEELLGRKSLIETTLQNAKAQLDFLAINQGNPCFTRNLNTSLHTAYSEKSTIPNKLSDPDKDRCGVIWASPLLPFEKSKILEAVNLATQLLDESGFSSPISLHALNARTIHAIIGILFDRENKEKDAQATLLYQELSAKLSEKGFPPYRVPSAIHMHNENPLFQKIKKTLDPHNIIAPCM